MSDSVRPHRRQPTRLPCPWDSPGENTGVGCHFLLQCMKVKSESELLSRVRLLATSWTAAYQAPPSMGFSRQQYWSGVLLPSRVAKYKQVRLGFPGGSDGKESACNAGDLCSVPELRQSHEEENGYPLQCSYLENSKESTRAPVH